MNITNSLFLFYCTAILFFLYCYFFFPTGLPVPIISNEALCCFLLASAKLPTIYTCMAYILHRNKIFITHLEKCIQTTCLAFMGDVERFENMLCFPSHLHRWMGSLGKSFLLTLVPLCPLCKHLKPTQPLFPFLPWCNGDKLKCFHLFISLANQRVPKHVVETQRANKAWTFSSYCCFQPAGSDPPLQN